MPRHHLPPFDGFGLEHDLVRNFVPYSQVTLHSEYGVQEPHEPSTAQGGILHFFSSLASPSQDLPPWAGAGLEHVLVRTDTPSPHVTLHAVYSDQFDHDPSIEHVNNTLFGKCQTPF